MNINELIDMIHKNAVAHGFWETNRPYSETVALIHSEISEALEEYRADRPLVWYECSRLNAPCKPKDEYDCEEFDHMSECEQRKHKPEGIAIELVDAVIRILDFFGRQGETLQVNDFSDILPFSYRVQVATMDVPLLVTELHSLLSQSYIDILPTVQLRIAIGYIDAWVTGKGYDLTELILEKHRYNVTREYKHGKII